MKTQSKTTNLSRKTVQLDPTVHEQLMARLSRYRLEVGHTASINQLIMLLLREPS